MKDKINNIKQSTKDKINNIKQSTKNKINNIKQSVTLASSVSIFLFFSFVTLVFDDIFTILIIPVCSVEVFERMDTGFIFNGLANLENL